MAKTNQKSKKDVAFEQERAKFRHQIRDLEREVKVQKIKNWELEVQLEKKDVEIGELREWIDRLLEYMDLSEDEMKRIIDSEKQKAVLIRELSGMSSIFGRYLHL